jgi:Ser/Thr protein kinase RdoA (MazF antagonist)
VSVEVPLLGGTANQGLVHRVGDTVRRPMRPTTPATHALLRHLEEVGFDGAPRVLGVDDAGREVLSYVPGQAVTAPAPRWGLTDSALISVARLLRRFHDATAGFDPSRHRWSHPAPEPFAGTGIAHNDLNLDNVVFRGGTAVALIDFDLAAPATAVWDVAGAARLWAPLRDPCDVTDVRRGRELYRLRLFVDAYGLDDAERAAFLPALRESHRWMCDLVRDGAERGVPGFAAYWTREARARADRAVAWFDSAADEITRALT